MRKRQILWLAVLIQTTVFGHAQSTATINWTNVHQVIDGFGASDAFQGAPGSTTPANQALFFGTGSGQLGYSILRVCIPSGSASPYCSVDCNSVGIGCAGPWLGDMQAVTANGGKVYASSWTPPAQYTTNNSTTCSGNSGLAPASYANYATWLANFVQSLAAQGVPVYGLNPQQEPDICGSNLGYLSPSSIDAFIKGNLGPTFASDGISTLITMPETGYTDFPTFGGTCATDSACASYVGIYGWQDYNLVLSGTNTVTPNPVPSGWASGKKYWETEVSCPQSYGPSFCQHAGYDPSMTEAINWAAVIDQRIAGDGANAWLYWWLYCPGCTDDEALSDGSGNVAKRGYVLAQYSKFVRPGYYRIDATRAPQTGISVSSYQNTDGGNLVIIATNYTGSSVSQTFNITNAPTFSTLTPTITSASQNLAQLSNVPVSNNSFTYTLPAQSITTFLGSTASISPPTNLTGTVVQ
jgi:glucuronoarabinoxylan endo-1,4-beta-xylanase